MRMKLGTLKRIIREAVGEALSEGRPPPYDVDKNLQAAIAMNKFVADLPSTRAVAADRERQAAGDAAYREREKARAAARPARDKKYLDVLAALPGALSAAHAAQPLEKQLPDFNPKDAAFRLKIDVNEHPGLDDPNMAVEDVAAKIADAAVNRITGPKGRNGTKYSKYDK